MVDKVMEILILTPILTPAVEMEVQNQLLTLTLPAVEMEVQNHLLTLTGPATVLAVAFLI